MKLSCLIFGHPWHYLGIYWAIPGPVWICPRCLKCKAQHDQFFAEEQPPQAGGDDRG